MVGKRVLVSITIILIAVGLFGFVLPKTGFSIAQETVVNDKYLEDLREQAGLECLKNSQCGEGYVCVGNVCVEKADINLCESTDLYFRSVKLKGGDSISSLKEIITDNELPYLLSDGELIEINEDKLIEYFYTQTIWIGNNTLERDSGIYQIKQKTKEPLYTYFLTFSKPVDFSSKKIQGQILNILGNEYAITGKSDNDKIELSSISKKIVLKDKENNVNVVKNSEGKVLFIEIPFYATPNRESIKVGEVYTDSLFNAVKLNFKYVSQEGFADVKFGGKC